MNEGTPLAIRPLREQLLEEIIRIHRAALGHTLNSRLGPDHLMFLYRSMARDPGCYVGVAMLEDQPAGVVSGSIDAGRFTSTLFRSMARVRLASTALKMLLQPRLTWLWWQGMMIAAPVRANSLEVRAVLTAIAVDPEIQRKGIGRALVDAFEDFLRHSGVHAYRLDTQIRNERAMRFYGALGFQLAARRADSVVFVRQLG